MPRRFNCCQFNHPCPIFCPLVSSGCSNEVVNPVLSGQFGFFQNVAVGEIDAGGVIPLSATLTSGISESGGSVVLPAGSFYVSYFAQGTVPTDGELSVALTLEGAQISGTQISASGADVVTLSQTIAVDAGQGGTLSLVNASSEAVDFSNASVFVQKI